MEVVFETWGAEAEQPAVEFQQWGKAPLRNTLEGEDIAKSAGRGAANAAAGLMGGYGDMRSILRRAGDYVMPGAGKYAEVALDPLAPFTQPLMAATGKQAPTSAEVRQAATEALPEAAGEVINYEPQTRLGGYARTAAEYAPAALMPAKTAMGRAANVLLPAAGSEAAGQATEGTKLEPYARVAGGVGGALMPGMAARVATPIPASPVRQQAVAELEREGVKSLTAGQKTGSDALRYAESLLGDAPGAGGKASKAMDAATREFTGAAMARVGARGADALPESMAREHGRISNEFVRLSAQNTLVFDNQFGSDMMRAVQTYMKVPASQQKAIVEGYVQDIVQHLNNGTMPGAFYQEMRSRLTRQAQGLRNSDPTLADTLRGMRDALDKNMARSIHPTDAQAWQTARREYGNMKTLEKVASRAGEQTAEGMLTPANLRNAVAANDRGAYARGQGDFADLARAGANVMTPVPQSGTGPRNLIGGMAGAVGGGLGAVVSGGNPMGAMGGAAAGAAVPAAAGRVLMNPLMQKYLANQRFANREPMSDAMKRALVIHMLAGTRTPQIAGPSN